MSSAVITPHTPDEHRQAAVLATTTTVFLIVLVGTALRLLTRILVVRNVGWDDYTIICAALGNTIGFGLVLCEIHYGLGLHKANLGKWQFIEAQKYSYGEWIQIFQTLMFNKLSICFFLLRIPVEKVYIRPIQGTIVGLIVSNIILTLLWIFQCNPIAGTWNKMTPATCFTDAQLLRIIITQAIISIISDFMMALFPIALLWKVQISLRTKFGLCSLMALGLVTAAVSLVRTVLNWQNITSDPLWDCIPNWHLRSWEVCAGITAANIPAMRPGYKVLRSSLSTYLSRRASPSGSGFTPFDQDRNALFKNETGNGRYAQDNTPFAKQPAWSTAAHSAKIEADHASRVGEGVEGFAMQSLPGDMSTNGHGIQKTTTIDVEGTSADWNSSLGNLGRAEGRKAFV